LDLQLTIQSVPITTCEFKSCSWRDVLVHLYVTKLSVTCGRLVVFSGYNKIDIHNITEILLKVELNTIPPPPHTQLVRINESMYFLPTPSTPPSEQLVTVSGGGGLG
jgi:hypothetical protein